MDVIFVGGFFPKHLTQEILNKSLRQVQNSANTFQWAFIGGLEKNLNKCIKLVTAPYIGWFPKYYSDYFLKSSQFCNSDNTTPCAVAGFINFPFFKNVFKHISLTTNLKKIINSKMNTIVFVYSLDVPYLAAVLKVKKLYPNLKVCLIIPDLHEFPGDCSFLYKCYLKFIEKPIFYRLLSQVDSFVVLTDKIVDYLKINDRPWVRIEGLYEDQNHIYESLPSNPKENVILYTGTLDYKYGIKELLCAFQMISSKDYRLWICGGGAGADLVKEMALADDRISYFGIVSMQRASEMQRAATILINPRNNTGEYNKYSFPSKTMEYLASGTPTLLYRLDGIPDEYFNYCYTVDDDSITGLANAIINVCNKDTSELKRMGKKARQFILTNKSADKQCLKVFRMLHYMFDPA